MLNFVLTSHFALATQLELDLPMIKPSLVLQNVPYVSPYLQLPLRSLIDARKDALTAHRLGKKKAKKASASPRIN